jgi:membrane-bound inhibitor of C-type lysozyme
MNARGQIYLMTSCVVSLLCFACANASEVTQESAALGGTAASTASAPSLPPQDVALSKPREFACNGLGIVTLRDVGPDTIVLALGTEEPVLTLRPAASGARYANDRIEFWNKGKEAMLTVGDERHACTAR